MGNLSPTALYIRLKQFGHLLLKNAIENKRYVAPLVSLVITLAVFAWLWRYELVTDSGKIVRLDRWTGTTEVANYSDWRTIKEQ